jgi:hypothetical protein
LFAASFEFCIMEEHVANSFEDVDIMMHADSVVLGFAGSGGWHGAAREMYVDHVLAAERA